jgi:hypothetical protein
MKQLHDKVNIIPVIAKADTLTEEEIAYFKAQARHATPTTQIVCPFYIFNKFDSRRMFWILSVPIRTVEKNYFYSFFMVALSAMFTTYLGTIVSKLSYLNEISHLSTVICEPDQCIYRCILPYLLDMAGTWHHLPVLLFSNIPESCFSSHCLKP